MRKLSIVLLAAAFVLLGAATSYAQGTSVGGTFIIRLSGLPPLALGANGGFSTSTANTQVVETPGEFGPSNIDLPDSLFTGVPQISDLRIAALAKPGATATFNLGGATPLNALSTAAAGAGAAAVAGTATICVFACAGIQVAIPLTLVGAGGKFFGTALYQPLTVTAAGGWTTGQAVISGINSEINSFVGNTCAPVTCGVTTLALGTGIGVYVTQVTITGTNNLTAGGSGQVTLVTPVLTKSLAGALPLFGIQTLVFSTPEPGTLLLIGSGIAGLVALGTRRARR